MIQMLRNKNNRISICIIILLVLPIANIGFVKSSSVLVLPIELVLVSKTDTGGDAYDVWVDENFELAYVTCGYGGLRIFDISNPERPVLLSHVPESDPLISTGHNSGYAHQLYVFGNIVYIGDGPSGLTIIDSSDPTNPIVLTHYVGGYTWDVSVKDDLAYIVNGWNNQGNPGFMILNISDPSNPIELSNSLTTGDTTDLEVVGNRAYLIKNMAGMTILDISNYSNPKVIGQYSSSLDLYPLDVEISENLAFVNYWKHGLIMLDITDPTDIIILSEFTEVDDSTFLSVNDGLVYLAAMTDGVVVFNLTNPNFPVVGKYTDTGKAYGIFAMDKYVFVADQDEGLKILEIATPKSDVSSSPINMGNIVFSLITFIFVMKLIKRKN